MNAEYGDVYPAEVAAQEEMSWNSRLPKERYFGSSVFMLDSEPPRIRWVEWLPT